jgi:serine/threonine protein kinase
LISLSRFLDGNQSTLAKLRGTYAYCATEVYFGQKYTVKSDIYSMGIILWEMVARTIRGFYERPFGEFTHIAFDFQTILQAAKHNVRPTIPVLCPTVLTELIKSCWDGDPAKRPESNDLVSKLVEIQTGYFEKEPKKWNDILKKRKKW